MRKLILLATIVVSRRPTGAAQPGVPTPAIRMPGNSLSGVVKDSAGGKPLAGVSVFLNNTSRGTVTHADGSFLLPRIPKGSYQLVFSAIGYATVVMDINGGHLPGCPEHPTPSKSDRTGRGDGRTL